MAFTEGDSLGVILSIARSRLALMVKCSFLGIHSIANLLGLVYRRNTPQLYERNSHAAIGWVITLIVVAQCIMEMIIRARKGRNEVTDSFDESGTFLPVTAQTLEQYQRQTPRTTSTDKSRFSEDSGHHPASEPSRSQSISSTDTYIQEEEQRLHEYRVDGGDEWTQDHQEKAGLLANRNNDRADTGNTSILSGKTLHIVTHLHNFINRSILVLGFAAFATGAVVYGGVFVSAAIHISVKS